MKLMELYYRAFRAFRRHTKQDEESEKLRNAITHSNHEDDVFTTIKYECKIDVNWVENIEEGLEFARKAINEEHQFIRSEGEVVPIEKVKRISKSSVEHLSRHSNFITRMPEDNSIDVIPEKLYIVEKLSDYLVYENRFLYLLLRYVKDFIELRLNSIKDKTSTYQSELKMDKTIEERSRQVSYKLEYSDLIKNDPYLIERFHEIPLAVRVETIYAVAVSLLATPLMKAVAKAPLIKPPVIKTNVLRMNQNFKAALKLYDYITAYNEKGYEIIESKKTFQPFKPEMSDEVAETIELTSVLGYISGNDIREELEKKMEEEEKQQQEEINRKKVEELNRLKKRIVEMNEDPVEYMFLLEKRNAELEKLGLSLSSEIEKNNDLTIRINEMKKTQQELEQSMDTLKDEIQAKNEEIERMNHMYYEDMQEAETVHQQELFALEQKHKNNVEKLKEDQLEQQRKLQEVFNNERENLQRQHQNYVKFITEKFELEAKEKADNITTLEGKIKDLDTDIKTNISTIDELHVNVERLQEEKKHLRASYLALRAQQGLLSEEDDYTSKEAFKQLEAEMKAYKKLFREQWKKAKRAIRNKAKEESILVEQQMETKNKKTK